MPLFQVTKGHDAYVNYTTIVEANDAIAAGILAGNGDYDGEWIYSGFNEYDYSIIHDDLTVQTDDPVPVVSLLEFSTSELNAMLAGLRLLQQEISRGEFLPQGVSDIFDNGGTEKPLTADEIDQLCERINQ